VLVTCRHQEIRDRFVDALEGTLDIVALQEAGRTLVDSYESLASTVQHEIPVLQVRTDTLCVPVMGELDPERTSRMIETVVALAIALDADLLVFDLTGARLVGETPLQFARVVAAVRALGIRCALSGVGPDNVLGLAMNSEVFVEVRMFGDLGGALVALWGR
jgi:anti-anti-sigma regulatory factor